MKIALIGASGQVGSRLLKELSDRGHAITAIAWISACPGPLQARVGLSRNQRQRELATIITVAQAPSRPRCSRQVPVSHRKQDQQRQIRWLPGT
jgi:nucleoside-diphosphate-sugar epimerase